MKRKIAATFFAIVVFCIMSIAVGASDADRYIVSLESDVRLMSRSDKPAIAVVDSEELERLKGEGRVLYYEPDQTVYLCETSGELWNFAGVGHHAAVESGYLGSGVRVAVIDSGLSEVDKFRNVAEGHSYISGDGDVTDELGHGTFVSGIIASEQNGMAADCTIVPLKCFNQKNASLSNILQAVYDAVDVYDCSVINMSFGFDQPSELFEEAVKYAYSKGAIIVSSAGNSGKTDLMYPAAYDEVIGVGAVDSAGNYASFSQHNESVFVTAPGRYIESLRINGFADKSGTSFATPHVSALAAVALNARGNLTPDDFMDLLADTSTDKGDVGYDSFYGWGIINFEKLISTLLNSEEFSAEPVDEIKIENIDTPSIGNNPDFKPDLLSDKVRIDEIVWVDDGGAVLSQTDSFGEGYSYTCRITVSAKRGYCFESSANPDVYFGDRRAKISDLSSGKAVLYCTYAALYSKDAVRVEGIDSVNGEEIAADILSEGFKAFSVVPENALNRRVTVEMSIDGIVSYDEASGKFVPVGVGKTNVEVITKDGGYTLSFEVSVECEHRSYINVEAKESTCSERGWKAYKKCGVCQSIFTTDLSEKLEEIPYLPLKDHSFGEYISVSGAYHVRKCSVCHEIEHEEHSFVDRKCEKCQCSDKPAAAAVPSFKLIFTADGQGGFTAEIPEMDDCEYSFDGLFYSDKRTLEGCAPATAVTGYARLKETATENPGEASSNSGITPDDVYVTVSFITNGGSAVKSANVYPGETLVMPEPPVKEGFTFIGWFKDEALTQPFGAEEAVRSSMTLYAGWTEEAFEMVLVIGQRKATVCGKTVENDVAPMIRNDRTMLPIRFISENVRADVGWDSGLVTITKGDVAISFFVGDSKATVNGTEYALDSPSFIENDRTYVPVRFVTEFLGYDCIWNDAERSVTIREKVA